MKRDKRHLWLISMTCAVLSACGPSDDSLLLLGRAGSVQADAPVKATSTMTINAPVSVVWTTMTDIAQWPRWQQDVHIISLDAPLGNGALFTWETGGTKIRSQVVLFSQDKAVAWVGHASIANAVHVFTVTAIDANTTRVESKESMDGPMLSWFYSSAELQASEDQWLKSLKVASESSQSSTDKKQ